MNSLVLKNFPSPPQGSSKWPWICESLDSYAEGVNWPKITIVTPSYNQGQYIEETIRSVILQNYPNLEYIIIDGGSTDQSVDIIKKYEKWLTYWQSKPDKGQSDAVNIGWNRRSGELFTWLNSDDIYYPNVLKKVAANFMSANDMVLIFGKMKIINTSKIKFQPAHNFIKGKKWNLLDTLTINMNPIPQSSAFMRCSAVEGDILDCDLTMSMDWDLWLRLDGKGTIRFIDEIWSYGRIHENAKTVLVKSGFPGFGPDKLKVIARFFSRPDLSENIKKIRRNSYTNAYVINAFENLYSSNFVGAGKYFLMAFIISPIFSIRKTINYLSNLNNS